MSRLDAAARAGIAEWDRVEPKNRVTASFVASHVDSIRAALAAADAVTFSSKSILRAAEAAALTDGYDGCFERVRAWEATEQWEKDAYPMEYPANDYEDCAVWLKRIRSAVAALKGDHP